MTPLLRFVGRDRRHTPRCGAYEELPGALVERLYVDGWKTLTVARDGVVVGGISPHPDTGHRIWWAEP